MKYCRYCGAQMQDTDVACTNCGQFVTEEADAAAPAAGGQVQPQQYQQYQTVYREEGRMHGMAVASLVLGICAFLFDALFFVPSILAIVFGAIAIGKVNAQPERYAGRGIAIAGLVCGIIAAALWIIIFVIAARMGEAAFYLTLGDYL